MRTLAEATWWHMWQDVMNVSGHRVGSAEVEASLCSNEECVEAAVVGVPHRIKGTRSVQCITLVFCSRRFKRKELQCGPNLAPKQAKVSMLIQLFYSSLLPMLAHSNCTQLYSACRGCLVPAY